MPAPQRAQRRMENILWIKFTVIRNVLETSLLFVCLRRAEWKMSPAKPQKIVHHSQFLFPKAQLFLFFIVSFFSNSSIVAVFTHNYDSIYTRGPKIATEAKIKVNRSRYPSNKATVITFYDQFIWWSFFRFPSLSPPPSPPFNCLYLQFTLSFLQSPATFESTHKSCYCFTKRDARRTYELSMSSMSHWMFDWFKVLTILLNILQHWLFINIHCLWISF